uniref:non-specific serine/threonine protein kinase n=1 Tax=Macrostomum lignano TaxID=282301 RepID=A0A1I8IUY9_9PLAT
MLWSALHLFTDCADCLMMRHGVIAETAPSNGEPENCSVHSEHCWELQQLDGEPQQSVCSLCGSCSVGGSDCAFNRIDSGAPGRCLCGALGGASCDSCGVCGRCAARLWAVGSDVRPSRVLPGYIDDGDIADSSRCVRLCPSAPLQSVLAPEVSFSISPSGSQQQQLNAVFSTSQVLLEEPITVTFRLSAVNPVDDVMDGALSVDRRFSFALRSFCSVWQETGVAFYWFNTLQESAGLAASNIFVPVATLIGERRLTRSSSSFEICIENKGVKGNISIGVVPADFPVMAQPGTLPGSVDCSQLAERQSRTRSSKFSGPEAAPGCHVRCQLRFVGPSRARVLFSVDQRGSGSFEDCHVSEPVDVPPTGLFPCVTMQSPREAVRLTNRIPWLPATYAEQLPVGVTEDFLDDPADTAAVAKIFPEDSRLLCLKEKTEMQPSFSAVVALQLLAPGQTELKVTSSRHVICNSATVDPGAALSGGEQDQKRTAYFALSPKDQERIVILNVLILYPKESSKDPDSSPDAQSLEFSEFLRKECSLEISLDNKSAGHQEKRLTFDLQPEMSRHNSAPLVALQDREENRMKLGGSCDLLEVLENGVTVRKVLVPRRKLRLGFQRFGGCRRLRQRFEFPGGFLMNIFFCFLGTAVNYSRELSPGDWLRLEAGKSGKPGGELSRVVKADSKSVTLQPADAALAAVTVEISAGSFRAPDRLGQSELQLDPALPIPNFPSPNVLPRWNQTSDLTDDSILYGQPCRCVGFRGPAGFGRSVLASLAKKAGVGHGFLWVFLPELTSEEGRLLCQPSILDVADSGKLKAHLLCNSGSVTDVHLVDSAGVKHPLPSALDCHLTAQAAVRALMQHRLMLPCHELLTGPGHCRSVAEAVVKRLLLLGAALSHWRSLFAASAAEQPDGLEDLKKRLTAEFTQPPGGPLVLQAQQQQGQDLQPVCRAHQLAAGSPTLIDELVGSAAAGEGEAAVAATLATFGSCVRSALISSRLISSASCLTGLTGLETLHLHRMEKMQSLDKSWPMQRLRSLTITQSDLLSIDCNAPNLQSLTISIAKVSQLPNTCSTKLESLTLDRCLITALPASIGQLDRLTMLHLLQLPIRTLPKEFSNLRSLQELVIDGIAWPDRVADQMDEHDSGAGTASPLDATYLRNPGVTLAGLEPVPPEQQFFSLLITEEQAKRIADCRGLHYMLTDVPRMGLESVDDDETGGIPPCLFELTNLRELRLSHQAIHQVPDKIKSLKKLQRLVLDHNPRLKSLSPCLSELPQLSHVDVSRCPSLQTPPVEVAKRGSSAMLSYLKFLASDQVECKRTKLMRSWEDQLAARPAQSTGTTSVIGAEEITDGIDIGDWQIDIGDGSPPLHFSTWDFAGQRVYYNTHQFFLTHRAVYLLLYTVRTGYEHAGLNFWLSSIASHAPNAPILVVGTHADQVEKPDKIPMETFKSRYPQICGFHIISSHSGMGIGDLRKQLVQVALQQPYMSERLPRIFLDFEDRLIEKRTRDHVKILDWQEVADLAQSQGLYEDKHVRQAVSFLNDIGSVQYFDTDYLRHKVVINPKWIVDVMACVVSVKNSPIQNGQLKRSDIPAIWSKFDPALHEWLLKLTEAFDLTYAMKEDCNIVPCLLPEDVPEYSFPQEADGEGNTLARFIYQFDYLPAGLFNRAQVRLFEFTDSNTIWKRGSLLRKDAHIAVITMDERQRLIATVFGPRPENVLFMINDVFDSLIKETFHGVHYEEILPCPECLNSSSGDSERSVIRVAMIRKASSRQVSFLQCPFEFHILNLSQLLASIRPESLTEFDHQLEQSLLRLRRARLEMSRDVCLLFLADDFPKDGKDRGQTCPEAVAKKLEAEGLSCYPPYPEQQEDKQLHMSDCSAVLVFLTKSFGSDKACLNSLFSAKNNLRKKLVYLSVGADKSWRDCTELAFLVGTDKYIDLTEAKKSVYEGQLAEVIKDVSAAVETSNQKPSDDDSRDKDVFVSYCWANSHDAVAKGTRNGALGCEDSDPRRLRERLEAEGIRCWLDVKDTGTRSLFEDISSGLGRCPLVLAFVSDEYQRSANCMMEFRFAAKNLRKPIVTVVVGQTQAFKTQELGMLSLGYEEFDFRKDVPALEFKRLVAGIKSLLAKEAEKRSANVPLMKRKTTVAMPLPSQPGLFREEAELAQRRFLKQFSHSDLPRLLVPDFSDVTDFSDESRSKDSDGGKLEELVLIRVFCENQRGWHAHGPAVSLATTSKTGRENLLSAASVYLLRICSLLQASGIRLNCLEGIQAEEFLQAVRVEAAVSPKSFIDAYRTVQQLYTDATKGEQRHSGLSKCALGSGKLLWLCLEHQRAGNGRVTVLPDDEASGSGAQENLFSAGEALLRDLLHKELDALKLGNTQYNESVKKYMKYLEEQEKYIASKKHVASKKDTGDEAKRRLQRHRTSVAIGQLEAAAAANETGGAPTMKTPQRASGAAVDEQWQTRRRRRRR